jgi:hypothetical protein
MSEETLRPVLEVVRREEPALVIHVPSVPFNTRNTDRVMAEVKSRYDLIAQVKHFDIYARRR